MRDPYAIGFIHEYWETCNPIMETCASGILKFREILASRINGLASSDEWTEDVKPGKFASQGFEACIGSVKLQYCDYFATPTVSICTSVHRFVFYGQASLLCRLMMCGLANAYNNQVDFFCGTLVTFKNHLRSLLRKNSVLYGPLKRCCQFTSLLVY